MWNLNLSSKFCKGGNAQSNSKCFRLEQKFVPSIRRDHRIQKRIVEKSKTAMLISSIGNNLWSPLRVMARILSGPCFAFPCNTFALLVTLFPSLPPELCYYGSNTHFFRLSCGLLLLLAVSCHRADSAKKTSVKDTPVHPSSHVAPLASLLSPLFSSLRRLWTNCYVVLITFY